MRARKDVCWLGQEAPGLVLATEQLAGGHELGGLGVNEARGDGRIPAVGEHMVYGLFRQSPQDGSCIMPAPKDQSGIESGDGSMVVLMWVLGGRRLWGAPVGHQGDDEAVSVAGSLGSGEVGQVRVARVRKSGLHCRGDLRPAT